MLKPLFCFYTFSAHLGCVLCIFLRLLLQSALPRFFAFRGVLIPEPFQLFASAAGPFHPLPSSASHFVCRCMCIVCVCALVLLLPVSFILQLFYMQHGRVLHKEHSNGKITKHANATNMCDSSKRNETRKLIDSESEDNTSIKHSIHGLGPPMLNVSFRCLSCGRFIIFGFNCVCYGILPSTATHANKQPPMQTQWHCAPSHAIAAPSYTHYGIAVNS